MPSNLYQHSFFLDDQTIEASPFPTWSLHVLSYHNCSLTILFGILSLRLIQYTFRKVLISIHLVNMHFLQYPTLITIHTLWLEPARLYEQPPFLRLSSYPLIVTTDFCTKKAFYYHRFTHTAIFKIKFHIVWEIPHIHTNKPYKISQELLRRGVHYLLPKITITRPSKNYSFESRNPNYRIKNKLT